MNLIELKNELPKVGVQMIVDECEADNLQIALRDFPDDEPSIRTRQCAKLITNYVRQLHPDVKVEQDECDEWINITFTNK